jgi:hypothetical protein
MFWLGLSVRCKEAAAAGLCVMLGSLGCSMAAAQGNPWSKDRQRAMVRVEVTIEGEDEPRVGAGFIVKGKGENYFVVTATHAVLPDNADVVEPDECLPLRDDTILFRTNRGSTELLGDCVYHLGKDISLILLEPGEGEYPTVTLSARPPAVRDRVYLAGYPEGGRLDANRNGIVTQWDPDNKTLKTDMTTTGGMSGGPYLDAGGSVVGVHRGGLRFEAGFPRMTPIWTIKAELERYLPDVKEIPLPEETAADGPGEPVDDPADTNVGGTPRLAVAVTSVLNDPQQRKQAEQDAVLPLRAAVSQLFKSATGDQAPVFDSATSDDASGVITYLAGIVFDRTLDKQERLRKLKEYIEGSVFLALRDRHHFDSLYLIDIDRAGLYQARAALITFGEGGGTYQNPAIELMYKDVPIKDFDQGSLLRYAATLHEYLARAQRSFGKTKVVYAACFNLLLSDLNSPVVLLLRAPEELREILQDLFPTAVQGRFKDYKVASADYYTCDAAKGVPPTRTGLAPEVDGSPIPPEVVVSAEILQRSTGDYDVEIQAMQPWNLDGQESFDFEMLTADVAQDRTRFKGFLERMAGAVTDQLDVWMDDWAAQND